MEAGSNSFELHRRLLALGLRAVVMESCHVGKHAKTYADNDKMAAARTPEERQALMAEHMKLMQEGMAMMGGMGPGMGMGNMPGAKGKPGGAMSPQMRQQMMEKRMDMMQSMMQMMMDRMQAPMPASK